MKIFLKETLKPLVLITTYFLVVAWISNLIAINFDSNITIVSTIILLLLYPLYYYLINK